ncbi:MAG: PSD1 domain-containing protein [Planctomycetes bacterium]|nr:PSD1 domain-containing protein [Planctomycetota bacterium]
MRCLPCRWLIVLPLAVFGCCVLLASSAAQTKDLSPDHAVKMAKGIDLFKRHVRPILADKCLRCHGSKAVESELDLSDRDGLLKGGVKGPAIVAGKSKDSLLIKLISHAAEPHMPKGRDKLPAEAIALISQWIDHGAPYDNPLVAAKLKKPSWTERVLPGESKRFWSFEPLAKLAPPRVKNVGWCRTPVDGFILAQLEDAGIQPNPQSDKHLLIRRAYFDLVGLPPPPEEVEAYLKDSSPDAYGKLIDRLLAGPHYGERLARHWLDLARFAESHGFEHDYDRPSSYHYRDFVIEALNLDLPFDTFVKWQIAGDEYEPNNNLALKATGFLAAGVHSTQITKNEVEKHRYDEMDDKLATIGTAMLGLTVGCARCHDHKFDPIPQRDYYRLLSTFTTTVRSEIELNLDPVGYANAKAAFDREHEPFLDALKKFEETELPMRWAEWEKAGNGGATVPWEVVELSKFESKEGAKLTLQSDGSLLASGKNAKFDTYTLVAKTKLRNITSVRLEALTHPSMSKGGPGRAGNGNFALSDFKLTTAPTGQGADAPGTPVSVVLRKPRATFEQKGLPIAAAIDTDAKSAWAVDPQFGKDHAAAFETDPFGFDGGTVLTFTLHFNNNDSHNLGRPRLAISSGESPDLLAPGMPPKIRAVLVTPSEKRNAEQTAALLGWFKTTDSEWRELNRKREEHLIKAPKPLTSKCLIATEGLPAIRLHTQGDDFLPETHFLRRGDPDNKEGVATQSFLQVLMPGSDSEKRWRSQPPTGSRTSYRRRAMAEWLTDNDNGAGQLLARVIVNRLWQHHMGRGIVATPSDFGVRGERPTHPELLDYLAGELIQGGWKLKPIHKLIMTSAVYQQSSALDEARAKVDRDNKLFWRRPSRRLEAEVIRDTLLAVSGSLDPKMYGPGTLDEASKRRSIYFTVKRSKLMPMMVIFDAPEALSGMAERPTTTIAPQALHLLNNPQVRQTAKDFARRIAPDSKSNLEDAVRMGYRIAVARNPTREEMEDSLEFVNRQMATYPGDDRRQLALADLCQVLMCLNEFVYVD